MLDEKQLDKLRSEIKVLWSRSSLDYQNSLGICPNDVQKFFDGYVEFLFMLKEEDEEYGIQADVKIYDSLENLLKYYETFDDDPLPFDKTYAAMVENRIEWDNGMYNKLKNAHFAED